MEMTEIFSKQNIARKSIISIVTLILSSLLLWISSWVWTTSTSITQIQESMKHDIDKFDLRELELRIQKLEMNIERDKSTRMIVKQITEDVMNEQFRMLVRLEVLERLQSAQQIPVKPDKIIKVDSDSLMKLHEKMKQSKYKKIDQMIQRRIEQNIQSEK